MAALAGGTGTPERSTYSRMSITLHWIIALLIVSNVILALLMDGLLDSADPSDRGVGRTIVGVHKSIGLTVLTLSLVRLAWRLTHGFPRLPEHMARWEVLLARGNHVAFYMMMILVPLAGWTMSSAGPSPLEYFGLFDWPKLPVARGSTLAEAAHDAHIILAFTTVGLVVLHVAGALKHHFLDRDEVLARMLPLIRRRQP